MPTNTYVEIATATVTGSSGTISFTSIPATYTDLVISLTGSLSTGDNTRMRFNNDAGSNYSMTVLTGNGNGNVSGVGSYLDANQTSFSYPGYYDTAMGMNVIQIKNYSDTLRYKTFVQRNSKASNQTQMATGVWRSTAAINRVDIYTSTGATWTTATKATLYGIAVAPVLTPKASGGTITLGADGYIYHAFTSSGTFAPTATLDADMLVVAGGGGGGDFYSCGGGGAGGLQQFTSQSLAIQNYTVTVGAGGNASANGSNSQFGSLTASVGGGAGGVRPNNGIAGGSGGGGAGYSANTTGGAGTAGQGFAGANGVPVGTSPNDYGGGGGGAGAVGVSGTGLGYSNGGIGATSALINAIGNATNTGQLSNSNRYYAGGGGGYSNNTGGIPQAVGGLGGGGAGNKAQSAAATAGTANTGGGGGGGWDTSPNNGKAGGSGVVIIRYQG